MGAFPSLLGSGSSRVGLGECRPLELLRVDGDVGFYLSTNPQLHGSANKFSIRYARPTASNKVQIGCEVKRS